MLFHVISCMRRNPHTFCCQFHRNIVTTFCVNYQQDAKTVCNKVKLNYILYELLCNAILCANFKGGLF